MDASKTARGARAKAGTSYPGSTRVTRSTKTNTQVQVAAPRPSSTTQRGSSGVVGKARMSPVKVAAPRPSSITQRGSAGVAGKARTSSVNGPSTTNKRHSTQSNRRSVSTPNPITENRRDIVTPKDRPASTSPSGGDPISDIFSIERAVRGYLGSHKNITKQMNQELGNYVGQLVHLATKLAQDNAKLQGSMEVLDKMGETVGQMVEAELSKTKCQVADRPVNHGQAVPPAAHSYKPMRVTRVVPTNVEPSLAVIIRPKKVDATTAPSIIKDKVLGTLKPREQRLYIRKVKTLKEKRAVLIETGNTDSLKKILLCPELNEEHDVAEVGRKNPRIIVKHVPAGYDKEQLIKSLKDQNELTLPKQVWGGSKALFKVGPKGKQFEHWVLDVTPQLRKLIMGSRRMYLDFTSLEVDDFVSLVQCRKCMGYGHMANTCRSAEPVCARCGSLGHKGPECTSTDAVRCTNCSRSGTRADHVAWDRRCPTYIAQMRQVMSMTNYV